MIVSREKSTESLDSTALAGVMVYGTRLYGVLEANYSICIVHLVNWAFGPQVWRLEIPIPGVEVVGDKLAALVGPSLCEFQGGRSQEGVVRRKQSSTLSLKLLVF